MRAMSLNLFGHHGDWPARRELLAAGLLGAGYHLAHQTLGLVGDGRHHGASVASRWPILQVHEVDLHLTPRTGDYSCGTVIAELAAPAPRPMWSSAATSTPRRTPPACGSGPAANP